MIWIDRFWAIDWLRLLSAQDLHGAILRFVPIQFALLLLKVVQEYLLYGELDTPWHLMMTEVFLVSVPFVAFVLWLMSRLDRAQRGLAELASTDILTGLPNRRSFFQSATANIPVPGGVVLMADIDHFKRVNDTYGHGIGDMCLRATAAHITNMLRETDIIARIGGEEFAFLLIGATVQEAEAIGNRLAMGFNFDIPDQQDCIQVTVSVGGVVAGYDLSLDAMMNAADQALYQAKRAGRARLVMADTNTIARSVA